MMMSLAAGPTQSFVRHAATGTVWGQPFSTLHPAREPGGTTDNGLSTLVGDIGPEEDTEDPHSASGTDTPGRALLGHSLAEQGRLGQPEWPSAPPSRGLFGLPRWPSGTPLRSISIGSVVITTHRT